MIGNICERCGMNPAKKKSYVEFPGVTAFMSQQPDSVRIEYDLIVEKLEAEGRLAMPLSEKESFFKDQIRTKYPNWGLFAAE